VAAKPDGKNNRSDRVTFTRSSAERIAKVVRTVELGPRQQHGPVYGYQPEVGSLVLMGTFTGSWAKDTARVVTIMGTTATVSATNVFGVAGSTATGTWDTCIVRQGTAWFAIQAECVQ
jgi:hypothetical protein